MIDSVRTFVCKHQHTHSEPRELLALAIERGILSEQATEADLAWHLPRPEGEGHFHCYDAVAEYLLTGLTLSTRDVRRMLGTTHYALHQDRRFYDTADGHWYLAYQTPCNDALAALLEDTPGELLSLADFMAELDHSPCFWTGDSRFSLQDGLVSFKAPDPESGLDDFEFLDLEMDLELFAQTQVEEPEMDFFTEPTPEEVDLLTEPMAEMDLELFAQMQVEESEMNIFIEPATEMNHFAQVQVEPESLEDQGVAASADPAVLAGEVADGERQLAAVAVEAPSLKAAVEPDNARIEKLFEKLAHLQNLRSGLKV